jgi:hypothetical protein
MGGSDSYGGRNGSFSTVVVPPLAVIRVCRGLSVQRPRRAGPHSWSQDTWWLRRSILAPSRSRLRARQGVWPGRFQARIRHRVRWPCGRRVLLLGDGRLLVLRGRRWLGGCVCRRSPLVVLAGLLDLADVGLSVACVSGNGEHRDVRGGGIHDEADRAAPTEATFSVRARSARRPCSARATPRQAKTRAAASGIAASRPATAARWRSA